MRGEEESFAPIFGQNYQRISRNKTFYFKMKYKIYKFQ